MGRSRQKRVIEHQCRQIMGKGGKPKVLSFDAKNAYSSVDHALVEIALTEVEEKIPNVAELARNYIVHNRPRYTYKEQTLTANAGLCQGGPLSSLIYCLLVRKLLDRIGTIPTAIPLGYIDDLTIVVDEKYEQEVLELVQQGIPECTGGKINEDKTQRGEFGRGVKILGSMLEIVDTDENIGEATKKKVQEVESRIREYVTAETQQIKKAASTACWQSYHLIRTSMAQRGVHLMRTARPTASNSTRREIMGIVRRTMEDCLQLTDTSERQMHLPLRYGGGGLPNMNDRLAWIVWASAYTQVINSMLNILAEVKGLSQEEAMSEIFETMEQAGDMANVESSFEVLKECIQENELRDAEDEAFESGLLTNDDMAPGPKGREICAKMNAKANKEEYHNISRCETWREYIVPCTLAKFHRSFTEDRTTQRPPTHASNLDGSDSPPRNATGGWIRLVRIRELPTISDPKQPPLFSRM